MPTPELTVSLMYEGNAVTHFRVAGDRPKPVTVRTSVHVGDIYTCLTCLRVDCDHVRAAAAFDRERRTAGELQ